MNSFQGKNILVTGASSGIGKQIAMDSALCGATVILAGRNNTSLSGARNLLKENNHIIFSGDLTIEKNIFKLIEILPLLNAVVFSAGITQTKPIKFLSQKNILETFEINFNAVVLLTSALLKHKKIAKESSLVFISSIATKHPYRGGALYSSSKAALEAFSRTLAMELSSQKIRANCISPSFVKTPMLEDAEKNISSEEMLKLERMHPLGFGTPEDVSNAAMFLISDKAKWITGSNIILGGI